ncbi:hypothetical protein FRC08_018608 [Ceratobasidium sp. 394]|nr:hypothetical protein FRC08_018608 [Ceratobasidium sp. 394]KAG9089786.1 hypothetical protein FS749_001056 [Ceratobasidium sp. UAMH 11750]
MVFRSQVLHKSEHSGHNPECIVVYFYESTNIRGRELIKNFVDLPIPGPDGNCDCSRPSSPASPEAIASSSEPSTPPALSVPPAELTAKENGPFQHIEGPSNQLEWLADIALSSSCPLPTPPSSSTTSPQPPASALVTSKSKLAQRRTPRAIDSTLPASRTIVSGRPREGNDRFSFWRYKDSSKLRLGMAESTDDVPVPMRLQRRSIELPAVSGPAYYYVWNAKD